MVQSIWAAREGDGMRLNLIAIGQREYNTMGFDFEFHSICIYTVVV
jgi:hypothetical protein